MFTSNLTTEKPLGKSGPKKRCSQLPPLQGGRLRSTKPSKMNAMQTGHLNLVVALITDFNLGLA